MLFVLKTFDTRISIKGKIEGRVISSLRGPYWIDNSGGLEHMYSFQESCPIAKRSVGSQRLELNNFSGKILRGNMNDILDFVLSTYGRQIKSYLKSQNETADHFKKITISFFADSEELVDVVTSETSKPYSI